MKVIRTLQTAIKALRRNTMRAMLTTLGIVIGIAAVIAMMEIGAGSSAQLKNTISKMGANVIMIMPGSFMQGGVSQGSGSTVNLTSQDLEAIRAECHSLRSVAPISRTSGQVVYGNRNWMPEHIYGTTPEFLDIRAWTVAEGEAFTDQDVLEGNRVCLVGQTIVREVFGGESPIGLDLRINNVPLRVIGVFEYKGANMMGMDQDDLVVAPWPVVKYRIMGASGDFEGMGAASSGSSSSGTSSTSSSSSSTNSWFPADPPALYPAQSEKQAQNSPMLVRFPNLERIMVAAQDTDSIKTAMAEIRHVLRRRHNLADNQPDDFTIRDMTEMSNTLSSTSKLMSRMLLSVALISLLVGGVGIMNIMLVSVTERTREIGLRMAVGARGRDILLQFIIESIILCLIGGAIGILVGHGGSLLVEKLLRWPVETSPTAIAAAVLVSAFVGILFGFYPAWKASKLDPIDALHYE